MPGLWGALSYLGEDAAEQLELMRSAFRVIRTVHEKHACTKCYRIVQAPEPSRPIERGIAGPGLLARVLTSKYAEHTPLYRQSEIYARRKIHDVHIRTPSALTEEALKRIGELYAIEADIRGMPAEQRLAERQLKTKALLKSLENWLREKMKTLSRHSELAKAFAYALNQWQALTYYADNGWAEADNNIVENALRMVSLGRKTTCSSALIMVVSAERCCTA